jgi:mono/diheme cytochrome c family protein
MSRRRLLVTLAILVACLALEFTRLIKKPWPPQYFSDELVNFKYGSIGAEVNGFPYRVWRELPSIFAERIPNGWRQFGFIYEGDRSLPIGVSVRRYGVQRVGFNCATCHTSIIATEDHVMVLSGAPASQLDIQAYLTFLAEVSVDPKLTPDALFQSAENSGRPFSWWSKPYYKYLILPAIRSAGQHAVANLEWTKRRAPHGHGRTDAGNFWRARWGLHPEKDEQVGTVDFPSIWNQRIRHEGHFHWDGNNSSLTERNYSAALAGGASEWLLDRRSIGRISDWLIDLPSPRFPFAVDVEKARLGASVYQREACGACHDKAGGRFGDVTDLALLQTDPERVRMFTSQMVDYFHTVGAAYSWRFSHYRTTNGYANMPLDGIWARSPYLHNGSVPTLEDLLSPAAERPVTFVTGCITLNPAKVGKDCAKGGMFDTKLKGNSNAGHPFGTQLPPAEKSQLIEYLKTL